MTGSVLLHTPRRALLYLCYNAESFTFMIGAGIGGAADGYAAASFMLAATGRKRKALVAAPEIARPVHPPRGHFRPGSALHGVTWEIACTLGADVAMPGRLARS